MREADAQEEREGQVTEVTALKERGEQERKVDAQAECGEEEKEKKKKKKKKEELKSREEQEEEKMSARHHTIPTLSTS